MSQTYYQLQVEDGKQPEGFTLIEILAVIGIIGILASIAVVAFHGQRTSAINTTALTLVGDIAKLEALLFLDASEYGTTHTKSRAKAKKKGRLITGGTMSGYLVTSQNSSSNPQFREFQLSEGVSVVVAADSNYQSYVITTKHVMGDRRYCFDSDSSKTYYDNKYAAGKALKRSGAISATLNSDDCASANMAEL